MPLTNMLSYDCSTYLFHHVFLPSKIPQKNDFQPQFGHVFFDIVEQALRAFGDHYKSLPQEVLDTITEMVVRMRCVHDRSTSEVIEGMLVTALGDLVKHGMLTWLNCKVYAYFIPVQAASSPCLFERRTLAS
jgi:hypothetical protein